MRNLCVESWLGLNTNFVLTGTGSKESSHVVASLYFFVLGISCKQPQYRLWFRVEEGIA